MPHRLQQIVLADHVIAMLDKEGEQIESLGFEVNKLGAAAQLAAFAENALPPPFFFLTAAL